MIIPLAVGMIIPLAAGITLADGTSRLGIAPLPTNPD
jgi:hypothetical protein